VHKGAFDPCKIEAAGAVPALSTISFPSSHLGEGTRLLTGAARFETVGGSQSTRRRTPPSASSTTCSSVGFRAPCYERGGRGFESLQVGQIHQSVGEPGRPYLPWKQGIAGSNPARLTTSSPLSSVGRAPGSDPGCPWFESARGCQDSRWRNMNAIVCKTVMSGGSTRPGIHFTTPTSFDISFHALVDQPDDQRISIPSHAGSSPAERAKK
jgi:hypothetical protein